MSSSKPSTPDRSSSSSESSTLKFSSSKSSSSRSSEDRTSDDRSSGTKVAPWSSSYRLVAAERWKAKSALLGSAVTGALVEYARAIPGMKVIDLASGTGEPAITLGERVGLEGSVIALDQSAELLGIAAQRARNKGLTNVIAQQADAHSLPFPDRSFDLATCRFGVMFFADAQGALRELRRVLRPNARACFAAWGTVEQPYWQTTMKVVQQRVGGEMLAEGGANPFRFSAAGSLSEVLRAAGFHEVEESTRNLPWNWLGDAEEVFEYACAVSAPFRSMLERVPESLWPEIRAEAVAAIERYRVGDEIRFGADIVFASGRA
jgi:ubiquinone/menaquinone biosynthesis C-methylase UbiE